MHGLTHVSNYKVQITSSSGLLWYSPFGVGPQKCDSPLTVNALQRSYRVQESASHNEDSSDACSWHHQLLEYSATLPL